MVVLQGNLGELPDTAEGARLPAARGRARCARRARRAWLPIAILAVTIGLVAFNVVPVAIAFFGAGGRCWCCSARCPCARPTSPIEWPILVMLGALIPVSEAVRTTGATDLIAG